MRFGVARSLTASDSKAQIHAALTPAAVAEVQYRLGGQLFSCWCLACVAAVHLRKHWRPDLGLLPVPDTCAEILRPLFTKGFAWLPHTQRRYCRAFQAAACFAGSWTRSQQTQDFWSTVPHRWAAAESLMQSSAPLRLPSLAFFYRQCLSCRGT